MEVLGSTVYKVHPYRWHPIGSMVDLDAATMDDLKSFYKTFYAPNNAVLVVAGDFEKSKAKKFMQTFICFHY